MKEEKGKVSDLTRRDFLVGAGTVVVGGAIGAGFLSGCDGGETTTVTNTKTVPTTITTTITTTVGGTGAATVTETKTITEPGDGCVLPYLEPETTHISSPHAASMVEVKNGKIIRGRVAHWDSQYPDLPRWSLTVKGKTWNAPIKSPICAANIAYRKRLDSPNRVLYPLKRVDWEPGGDPAKINPQNRGISKYKKISWDEAATIIASEIDRVATKYGPSAVSDIYSGGNGEQKNVAGNQTVMLNFMQYYLLSKYGGQPTDLYRSPMTNTGGQVGGRYVFGHDYEPFTGILRDTAENCELLLFWGGNPDGNYWIYPTGFLHGLFYKWLGEIGLKKVFVTPDLNQSVGLLADKWIPVRPSTDCAFFMAIAYTWISEDTYDKDYIASHTVGFDKWKAYVMGDEDGVEKTPKWASDICGVPTWTIKAVAREWASKVTSIAYGRRGGGIGRAPYSSESQRMQLYLLGMQGWGDSGKHQIQGDFEIANAAKVARVSGVAAQTTITNAMKVDLGITLSSTGRDRPILPQHRVYEALYNPPVYWWHDADVPFKRQFPLEGAPDVHMIWGSNAGWTGGRAWGFRAISAYRSPKLECIVKQSIWLEDGLVFADIILPITTQFEQLDINGRRDCYSQFFILDKCVKPRGEAKSDFAAVCEVAKKLNWLDKITGGMDAEEFQEQQVKKAYDQSGMTDLISWEELNEKKYYAAPPIDGWWEATPPDYKFYQDPDKNPLSTPSGKFEFESQYLLEHQPDDPERPPVAHFIRGGPASEGWAHDEDLTSDRAKSYPLQVVSTSRLWGLHQEHTDIPWIREISHRIGWDGYAYSPLYMHQDDADDRGIKNGDIVRFYNERGSVLAVADVGQKVRPGVISMDQGGGADCIVPLEVNRGGNPNCINPGETVSHRAEGLAPTGWLAQVEKVPGSQWDEWRQNYPDAFSRDYDPAYGPFFSGWIHREGGE